MATLVIVLLSGVIHPSNAEATNYKGIKREFWLFNDKVNSFSDTKVGIPDDKFSLPSITVKKGDAVIIHFYNIEDKGGDNHSFTIYQKSYNNINTIVQPSTNQTITFTAKAPGSFHISACSINLQ